MSSASVPTGYVIRVLGRLDDRWRDRLDGVTLASVDGVTTLRGDVLDQAALHGILTALRDAGVTLLSVDAVLPSP